MAPKKQIKKETGKEKEERISALIRLNNKLMIDAKVLAVRQRKKFNSLVIEALEDILKKYESKK